MSKENLVKLLEVAAEDKQLLEQLQSASSFEEVKKLGNQQGLDLSDLSEEEAGRTVRGILGDANDELSEDELGQVAGGFENQAGWYGPFKGQKGFSFGVE